MITIEKEIKERIKEIIPKKARKSNNFTRSKRGICNSWKSYNYKKGYKGKKQKNYINN